MSRTDEREHVRACVALLERRAPRALSIPELAAALGLRRWDRRRLRAALESRVARGELRRVGKTRYRWAGDEARPAPRRGGGGPSGRATARGTTARGAGRRRLEGRFVRTRSGQAFVEVLGRPAGRVRRDLVIPREHEGAAMHGDRVAVELEAYDSRAHRARARVVAVTEAARSEVVGALERLPTGWCLIPTDELLPPVRLVAAPSLRASDRGTLALARLTRPPAPARWAEGELVRLLGTLDDPDVQFLTIALSHGLRITFPPEVTAAAERLPEDPDEVSWRDRRDLRDLPFVTIDGESARDFDDAVCLEREGNGWRLRVAIADVAHYVPAGGAVDLEAARRGTSVYFPDRAVPMLPERLSSALCSLRPHRPRLAVVVALRYDEAGQRESVEIERAVIESRARLTYTTVAAAFGDDPARADATRRELGDLAEQLDAMRALMRLLLRRRLAAGALDLDLAEAVVDLDTGGHAVGVRRLERTDAHRLIEEFMLEANRAVAARLREKRIAFPYRIHEPPDPAALETLNETLAPFGLRLDWDGQVEPSDVQRLLAALAPHRLQRLLARQVLRAMAQARYAPRNAGHFGLAFPIYCHFTSPIRRYPDLLVHRQLGRLLDDDLAAAAADADTLERTCVETSLAERRAAEAERAMLDLKRAEFMRAHLGEPGPGTVVWVGERGLLVELDAYPVEGLVPIEHVDDGRWRWVEAARALVGPRGLGHVRVGDRVVVETIRATLQPSRIEFALCERLPAAPARPARGRRRQASVRTKPPPRRGRGGRRP